MNYNKVILGGNITKDIELRHTPQGTAVADFNIAVNRVWIKDGNKETEVSFIGCVAWGKTAEAISKYFTKGSPIFVEGRLKQETWEKEGKKQSKTKVIVENFQFVESKKEDNDWGQ